MIETKTKLYSELSSKERSKFLKSVGELCDKSVTIYNNLIKSIHDYQTPLPVVGNLSHTIVDGEIIKYENNEDFESVGSLHKRAVEREGDSTEKGEGESKDGAKRSENDEYGAKETS